MIYDVHSHGRIEATWLAQATFVIKTNTTIESGGISIGILIFDKMYDGLHTYDLTKSKQIKQELLKIFFPNFIRVYHQAIAQHSTATKQKQKKEKRM